MDYADKINARKTVSKPITPERKPPGATEVSLKALFSGELPAEETAAVEAVSGEVHVDSTVETSLPELQEAWKRFCEKLETENRRALLAMLKDLQLTLDEKQTTHLRVQTTFQKKEIISAADEILENLRADLGNPRLKLLVEVAEEDELDDTPAYYTDKDKYKSFVEQNPVLDQFRKDLGLDVEF